MIHNKKHAWCTIEDRLNIDYERECDTHLLYMGNKMFGELLPKSVTKLGSIPNLLLSTPPIQNTAIPVNTENTEPDNAEMTDPAKFPNSVPEKASPAATTSHENTENPDYDRDLDIVLLASLKGTHNKGSCPVHPQCSTTKDDMPPIPTTKCSATSVMLAMLKLQCNVSLQRLSDEQLQLWIPSQGKTNASSDSSSTDSEDNVPLSELAKLAQHDDGFTSEDDIPLSDLNKPRTRSRTCKTPKSKT